LAHTVPADQVRQAPVIASSPGHDAAKPCPRASSPMPISPSVMPATSRRPGRTPYGHCASATIAGTTAMKATTSPDATCAPASAVRP